MGTGMSSEQRADRAPSTLWGTATDWSLVERAGGREGPDALNEAWWTLVERYREPIEIGLRKRLPPRLVEDGVRSFFTYLFEHQLLSRARRDKGRFRCFVQGVLRRWAYHYLRSERPPAARDLDAIELGREDDASAIASLEDQAWADSILTRAIEKLGSSRPQDTDLLLQAYGLGEISPVARRDLAARLALRVGALNVRIHHARRRLKDCIEEELRVLCRDTSSWEDEKRWMVGCLMQAHPSWATDEGGGGAS